MAHDASANDLTLEGALEEQCLYPFQLPKIFRCGQEAERPSGAGEELDPEVDPEEY